MTETKESGMKFTKRTWNMLSNISWAMLFILGVGTVVTGSVVESVYEVDFFAAPAQYYFMAGLGAAILFGALGFFCSSRAWNLLSEEEKQRRIEENRAQKEKSKRSERIFMGFAAFMAILAAVWFGSALLQDQLTAWFSPTIAKYLAMTSLYAFKILGTIAGAVLCGALLWQGMKVFWQGIKWAGNGLRQHLHVNQS